MPCLEPCWRRGGRGAPPTVPEPKAGPTQPPRHTHRAPSARQQATPFSRPAPAPAGAKGGRAAPLSRRFAAREKTKPGASLLRASCVSRSLIRSLRAPSRGLTPGTIAAPWFDATAIHEVHVLFRASRDGLRGSFGFRLSRPRPWHFAVLALGAFVRPATLRSEDRSGSSLLRFAPPR